MLSNHMTSHVNYSMCVCVCMYVYITRNFKISGPGMGICPTV